MYVLSSFFRQIVLLYFYFFLIIPIGFAEDSCHKTLNNPINQTLLDQKTLVNKKIVKNNSFATGRGLKHMLFYWGKSFKSKLIEIANNNGTWIDSGSGKTLALRQFLKKFIINKSSNQNQGKRIAISYSFPEGTIFDEQINYLEGEFIEDIETIPENSVDLITDMYGPISYSDRLDLVLKKYISWLKNGGSIFLKGNFNTSTAGFETIPSWINITLASGENLSIIEWLERIPGIKVEKNNNYFYKYLNKFLLGYLGRWINDGELLGISIKILDKSIIKIPELELEWTQPAAPPQMRFREVNPRDF